MRGVKFVFGWRGSRGSLPPSLRGGFLSGFCFGFFSPGFGFFSPPHFPAPTTLALLLIHIFLCADISIWGGAWSGIAKTVAKSVAL